MKIGVSCSDEMTDAQRGVVERVVAGPRGQMSRPILAMLDSPCLADIVQQVGSYLRFSSPLDPQLRELAIISVAWAMRSRIEFETHVKIGRSVGLEEDAILFAAGRRGVSIAPEMAEIVLFSQRIVSSNAIDTPKSAELLSLLGRHGFTDLIAICGYYRLLACYLAISGLEDPMDTVISDAEVLQYGRAG